MYFLATRFDIDWSATWENVRSMNPWLYAVGFLSYYASFIFRGIRWRILARSAGAGSSPDDKVPSVWQATQLIVIGWFVNSIAWLRLGDAYRAYAFAEECKKPFSWSLGTVLAERVIDTATIFGILLFTLVAIAVTSSIVGLGYLMIAAFLMSLVLVLVIVIMRMYGRRLARFLPNRLESSYHRFHEGTLGSFRQLTLPIILGFIGWLLEIARLYFVIQALGLELSIVFVPIVALGHAILSTVPTPGGVGAVEPGVTGLLLLSLERHDAVSIALLDRSITYLSVIAVGGIVFLARQLTTAKRSHAVSATREGVTQ
jgi:uncharacterized protein (TIRG00374 family)